MNRRSRPAVLLAVFVALGFVLHQAPAASAATAPATVVVEGWTLHIGPKLAKAGNRKLRRGVIKTLNAHLKRVRSVLKPAIIQRLQRVKLWATLDSPRFPGLVYHPSAKWLSKHGMNPAMANGVHIANAAAFIRREDTPWSIMHELAHAYHHQVLGYSEPSILRAYKAAKATGKYRRVKRVNAKPQRHYGLNNAREFFAEMTEAYLGVNDFYPFRRRELKSFDPATYRMVHGIWGPHLLERPVERN